MLTTPQRSKQPETGGGLDKDDEGPENEDVATQGLNGSVENCHLSGSELRQSAETRKEAADLNDSDSQNRILSWVTDAPKEFTSNLGTNDIKELEKMISLYLKRVSSCISKCYVPNRAAKMKRSMNDVLLFFNFIYQEIPEEKKACSTYLDKMTDLMAYYLDMEIQASSRAKENPLVIASKLTSSLFIFLDKSHDHILDAILKANNMNRNFWELCSLVFCGVLKETPNKILSELTYVRYVLVYKMWKRVVQGPEERKKVMSLASIRLHHPPQFTEKIRAGLLNGIIPKVPKKRTDVTAFLLQAKFDVKEKAKAFLKYMVESRTNVMFVPSVPTIKTDIPLLVGHLPDFGPSPSLIKMNNSDDEDDSSAPRTVDMSGSRLINDIWKSVNHEASFRETIRLQNVTTFCRTEAKVKEKLRVLRSLKQRRVREKVVEVDLTPDSAQDEPTAPDILLNTPTIEATIVLSDDSDKVNSETECEKEVEEEVVQKREPSPLPVTVELVVQAESVPIPDAILAPSQIKQEADVACQKEVITEENLVEAALEVPVVEKTELPEIQETEICSVDDEEPAKDIDDLIVGDEPLPIVTADDLKEEELAAAAKEAELNKEPLLQPASPELEKKPDFEFEKGKEIKEGSSPEPKPDSLLFDDEDNSWSPSGGNQEFFRSVVDNFISGYSPSHDVDAHLAVHEPVKEPFEEVNDFRDIGEVVCSPPAKRCCIEEEQPPVVQEVFPSYVEPAPVVPEVFPSYVEPALVMPEVFPSYVAPAPVVPEVFPSYVAPAPVVSTFPILMGPRPPLHPPTLQRDHTIYLLQTKFRESYTTRNVPLEQEVPDPNQIDPETGQLYERCVCEQCEGNYTALTANYHALVIFKKATTTILKNQTTTSTTTTTTTTTTTAPTVAPPVEQPKFDPVREEESSDQSERGGYESSTSAVQLPFKKRKAFSHNGDTGESIDDHYYPAKRMLSIAVLEAGEDPRLASPCSPPQPVNIPHTNQFATPPYYYATPVNNPAGGGFPPFTSVVPAALCPDPSSSRQRSRNSRTNPPEIPSTERRRVLTPAELKEKFIAKESETANSSGDGSWTHDLLSVAYFTRQFTNGLPQPEREPARTRKEQKTRKSGRSSKRKNCTACNWICEPGSGRGRENVIFLYCKREQDDEDLERTTEEVTSRTEVDISGSRLMNDIWESVNHEASFRETIRLQNVTKFCRTGVKVKEKLRVSRSLKQRWVRKKVVEVNLTTDSAPPAKLCCIEEEMPQEDPPPVVQEVFPSFVAPAPVVQQATTTVLKNQTTTSTTVTTTTTTTTAPTVAPPPVQPKFDPAREEESSDQYDSSTSAVQLPFKKRKAFSRNDDAGESNDDYNYPAKRMLSIAVLEAYEDLRFALITPHQPVRNFTLLLRQPFE